VAVDQKITVKMISDVRMEFDLKESDRCDRCTVQRPRELQLYVTWKTTAA